MNWVGEQLLGYGRLFRPDDVKRRLKKSYPERNQGSGAGTVPPERLNLAVVSPLKSVKFAGRACVCKWNDKIIPSRGPRAAAA